jgi:hypothetical protein
MQTLGYCKDNTVKDSVEGTGLGPLQKTGPARYDPILPEVSRYWEINLKRDIQHLNRNDLIIKWNVYVDNASPTAGELKVANIKV